MLRPLLQQRLCELLKALVIVFNQLQLVVKTEEFLQGVADLQVGQEGHAALSVLLECLDAVMEWL